MVYTGRGQAGLVEGLDRAIPVQSKQREGETA
jgi:hypothetical protein